ncbi:MAG: 2-oxoacid:acceptor oxidoreductase family protein, partial [Muribaculaceae bacterium]|nr:2-oxoacid:acceptor oxidoreductase family protein [Muribaculaceae bacterium]
MLQTTNIKTLDKVVVRFSGDSGDGMQLAGNIFTNVSAGVGNQVSPFPDYPSDMRPPHGSLGGVSAFQASVGKGVHNPGDECDVLVAMNPAALKRNYKILKPNGVIIVDIDSFNEAGLKKAQFETDDAFAELGITAQVVEAPISSMTKAALADSGLDQKAMMKCRNIFALGLVCWLFDRPLEGALKLLKNKFAKKPAVFEANAKVIEAGYDFGHNIHASVSTYRVETEEIRPGIYT